MKSALLIFLFAVSVVAQNFHVLSGRTGSETINGIETSKAVTFSQSLPSTNYTVILAATSAASLSYSSKTTNGFTINLAVSISGQVDWLAVMHQ